ncbi:glycosyltransferase [Modestobacter marinus]|uniref:glycosyltransferase n=1 Tax=Modestobacter marinus TaxID=477641 RepID=UPI001C9509E1
MAAGCPTVFTDCSGRPPVFEEGRDGLLARSEEPTSIRERIAELTAMSPADRAAMGAAGARLVRRTTGSRTSAAPSAGSSAVCWTPDESLDRPPAPAGVRPADSPGPDGGSRPG